MKTRSPVIAFKMSLRRNLKTNVLFALAAFALLSGTFNVVVPESRSNDEGIAGCGAAAGS